MRVAACARRRGLVGAAIVALVWLAFPVLSAHAQTSDDRWEPGEISAARALLAHVPAAFRIDCTLDEVFHKIPVPDGVVAGVQCDGLDPALGADSVKYLQFSTLDAMNAYYHLGSQMPGPTTLPGCLPDAPYTIGGQAVGNAYCVVDALGDPSISYTYEPLLVVGDINQFSDARGNQVDVAALNNFSNQSAGPDPTPGTIPSLMSDPEARQAANSLRSHIPAAFREACTAQPVVATPWVAASLDCGQKPIPGIQTMHFTSYRAKTAFSFNPKAEAARSEAQNNVCPNSGTWSSDGHVRGRYDCTYDKAGNTDLTWSLDSKKILAFAQTNQWTSKHLLAWWDQKAGLSP